MPIQSASGETFGYRVVDDGAVLWCVDPESESGIPGEPPEVENTEDPQAIWVWRVSERT